ncbi:MAG: RCC1 domain-containing protein, partial [Sedimentisphaerales bacterium]
MAQLSALAITRKIKSTCRKATILSQSPAAIIIILQLISKAGLSAGADIILTVNVMHLNRIQAQRRYHSLGLQSDGKIRAWGSNEMGQTRIYAGAGNDHEAIAAA